MGKSAIGWTDNSINPLGWHCTKVSQGCKFCYAEALAKRYGKKFSAPPEWLGDEWYARELRKVKPGERNFLNSFSDTFHEKVPLEWIQKIFDGAASRPDAIFQVLTKRIERALELAPQLTWHPNIWIGTSVESGDYIHRIDALRQIPTPNRFISFEPLIGKVGRVDLTGIAWVITGGESGPNRRYFDKAWALEIVEQAHARGVPVYHKQGGAFRPGEDRILAGRTYDEFPASWQVSIEPQFVPEQLSLFGD